MEAPTPIHIEDFQNTIFEHPFKEEEEYSLNKETKEYILEIDNISYKLIIYSENNEIIFSIEKNNELLLYNYKSKYNFKEIISILKLPLDIYNDTNKIIDLIDKAYDKNKILLKFDENKINIFLIIKMGLGFQEIDFPIKINRNDYNINQKFDIILKELLFLRQNKQLIIDSQLLEIEKIVKLLKETVNEKLNDNFLLIEKLRQKIENNEKLLENNKNEIQYLKDEIINIKDKEKLSSSNIIEKQKKNKNKNKEIKESKVIKDIKETNEIKEKDVNNNENIIEEYISSSFKELSSIKKLDKPEKEQFVFSIILDGAQKTGKTSIIDKFIGINNFNKNQNKNLGYQNNFKYIDIDNTIIKLDIIDFTIGDISKRSINNYKNANVIIFIYSIDDYVSFEKVKNKLSLMKSKSQYIIFLVGNKDDLQNREVNDIEARNLEKKYNINFCTEVSAKTGNNIDKMFFEAVKILYYNRKQVRKNTKVIGLSKTYKAKEGSNALNFLFPG